MRKRIAFFIFISMNTHSISLSTVESLYQVPLFTLVSDAHTIHKNHHRMGEIQVCHLISIKTGGCPEDCSYCAQSSRYTTSITPTPLLSYEEVMEKAKKALDQGASRICLGAAWRQVREGKQLEQVLQMIQGVSSLGLEVCCTLGMVSEEIAKKLKQAGLYAYNHNLDTSQKFYPHIITTRSYADRLETLDAVENASLHVCCGGILGLGETEEDRQMLLYTLAARTPQPQSVPVNLLHPIPGTPLEKAPKVSFWEALRFVAVARHLMPKTYLRLSAGRLQLSLEEQTLLFFAGINSLFSGEKLLTVANTGYDQDKHLFSLLGLTPKKAYDTSYG